MNAIIDFDDVMFNFHESFLSYLRDERGFAPDISTHDYFGFYEKYGISSDEFHEIIVTPEFISSLKPFERTKQAMSELRDLGVKSHVVTARGYMNNGHEVISSILSNYHIPHDSLHIVPTGFKKSSVYPSISSKFEILIDDAAHNISDAIEYGKFKQLFLVNQPWNKNYEPSSSNVTRVDSLISAVRNFSRTLSPNP